MILLMVIISIKLFLCQGATLDCNTLRMGQYMCPDPDKDYVKNLIDPKTQQIRGCTPENKAPGKAIKNITV